MYYPYEINRNNHRQWFLGAKSIKVRDNIDVLFAKYRTLEVGLVALARRFQNRKKEKETKVKVWARLINRPRELS